MVKYVVKLDIPSCNMKNTYKTTHTQLLEIQFSAAKLSLETVVQDENSTELSFEAILLLFFPFFFWQDKILAVRDHWNFFLDLLLRHSTDSSSRAITWLEKNLIVE